MPASSRKALFGALVANLARAIKFVVGGITRSTLMIAEGIHSLVDSGNSVLMLLGEKRSRRRPDDKHPFGYWMELYFWSFVVAMVVFAGQPLFEAAATIIVGLVLVLEAALLGFECRDLLIGEAARPMVIGHIRETVGRAARLGRLSDVPPFSLVRRP